MATLLVTLERQIISNLPLTIALLVLIVILAAAVAIRYNQKVTEKKAEREQARTMQHQQNKLIVVVEALPCVSRRTSSWLGKPELGGDMPDRPECSYRSSNAVEKGEI